MKIIAIGIDGCLTGNKYECYLAGEDFRENYPREFKEIQANRWGEYKNGKCERVESLLMKRLPNGKVLLGKNLD